LLGHANISTTRLFDRRDSQDNQTFAVKLLTQLPLGVHRLALEFENVVGLPATPHFVSRPEFLIRRYMLGASQWDH
jgi:hypothetical protein